MVKKSTFPGIARNRKQSQSESALTENIEILTGQRGNGESRALLYSDLINLDSMKAAALRSASSSGNVNGLPIDTGGVELPHAPVNVIGTGGFTFIALRWDHPTYKGHAYAEVWRSEQDSFSSAILVATEVADIFSDTVSMGAEYYYWVRFVNTLDDKGPIQGAAGIKVKTQKSAELILDEIGGLIENSHLSDFLSTAINKVPGLELSLDEVRLVDIPALRLDVDNYGLNIDDLRTDVDQVLGDLPTIQERIDDLGVEAETVKQEVNDARERVEAIDADTDSLARQLIESALIGDLNWENNTVKLYEFESKLGDVNARIESEFLTKTEANEAIAAAAETIQVMIEENGTSLSGDIANTYYTKATTDEAIALASTTLRSLIEDPEGDSVGATIFNDYYTKVATDSAISAYGLQLKSDIEDPAGDSIGALIKTDYSTTVETGQAISQATTQLKSTIDSEINATLTNDYYTKAEADSAIVVSSDLLKSEIEDPNGNSIGATLFNNYSTKADTDQAVASAMFQVSSEFELSAEPLAKAVIENALANDILAEKQNIVTANIIQKQEATTSQTEAIANSISIIEANYLDSEARVTELSEAFATNSLSTAKNILQLNSVVEDNRAFLETNYLTRVDTQEAIAQAETVLQTSIGDLSSDIYTNFSTITNTNESIAAAQEILKSEIEDPEGNSLGATVFNEFQTKVDALAASASSSQELRAEYETTAITTIENALANDESQERRILVEADIINRQNVFADEQEATAESILLLNSAIDESQAQLQRLQSTFATKTLATAQDLLKLNSTIGDVSADLVNNYSTTVTTNEAIASADLALRTLIEDPEGNSIGADLQQNYYTRTAADEAISSATEVLRAAIEDPEGNSIGALLINNYTTNTDLNEAVSTASETLLSEIGGVRSSLQQVSETVATNEGEYSALWGVKTTVDGLTSSIGLVNDGSDPIFAIKGAKLAVITDQDPDELTPVFAVSEGKTVINTAIIDEAFIKSLVTDDLLANRLIVSSRFTSPSINYDPASGARTNNFSIDPNGNMFAKSATLQSVTIKDNSGNVVMSSTGAIPSSAVTGLGDLAGQDSVNYNDLNGRPNLGAFAFIDGLGYSDLSGKPTLGSLAAKNSLSYNEVTGKPNLGSLAYLNSLAYDDVTGKPSLGPFAGLSKILSSNVTTYIANGAIGSAQIDQAYINQLFGQNASFYGTVYAQNLEGDITDTITKEIPVLTMDANDETQIGTLNVGSANFDRTLYIKKISFTVTYKDDSGTQFRFMIYKGSTRILNATVDKTTGVIEDILLSIPTSLTGELKLKMISNRGAETFGGFGGTVYPGTTPFLPQDVFFQIFKSGSTLS